MQVYWLQFFIKLSQLDKLLSRKLYYSVFVLSLFLVLVNILSVASLFSTSEFIEGNPFHYPVYNINYYVTLSVAIIIMCLYIPILKYSLKNSPTTQYAKMYKILLGGVYFSIGWHIVFGYFPWSILPPYPYIYSGVIWSYFLIVAMYRYDFIENYDSRYEKLFERNPDAIFLIAKESLQIVNVNPAAQKMLKKFKLNPEILIEAVPEDVLHQIEYDTPTNLYAVPFKKKYYFNIFTDYVYIDGTIHYLIIAHDATERVHQLLQIEKLAYYDALTKVPNRRYFDQQFMESQSEHSELVIALIDLDYLKKLNDLYGHHVGDEAICKAANILKTSTKSFGFVGRIGGDEFIVCLKVE